jgi:hypothetical protein
MNGSSSNNLIDDEGFLSLLSSQRQLLQRINMERAMGLEHQHQQQLRHKQSTEVGNQRHQKRSRRPAPSIIGPQDTLSLMNTPAPAHSHGDLQQSQRLMASSTLGFGDFLEMSSFERQQQGRDGGLDDKFHDFHSRIRKDVEVYGQNNVGFISSYLSEEHRRQQGTSTPIPLTRRLSLLSSMSGAVAAGDEDFDSDFDNLETNPFKGGPKSEMMTTSTTVPSPIQIDPNIPTSKVHENLAKFVNSMDDSTKSQQGIHDWDRKMGLKRSHSKTMRLTMRSRKRLRQLLKKDINSLSRKTHANTT